MREKVKITYKLFRRNLEKSTKALTNFNTTLLGLEKKFEDFKNHNLLRNNLNYIKKQLVKEEKFVNNGYPTRNRSSLYIYIYIYIN